MVCSACALLTVRPAARHHFTARSSMGCRRGASRAGESGGQFPQAPAEPELSRADLPPGLDENNFMPSNLQNLIAPTPGGRRCKHHIERHVASGATVVSGAANAAADATVISGAICAAVIFSALSPLSALGEENPLVTLSNENRRNTQLNLAQAISTEPPARADPPGGDALPAAGDERANADAVRAAIDARKSGDYEFALREFTRLAEQGDAIAQFFLGYMHGFGQGVDEDDMEAFLWYASAAEQGYPDAQYVLGLIHATGAGVPRNYVQAYAWADLAAAQGDAEAADLRDTIAGALSAEGLAEALRLSGDQ